MLDSLSIYELKNRLLDSYVILSKKVNLEDISLQIKEYESLMEDGSFWNDVKNATIITKQYNNLKDKFNSFNKLKQDIQDCEELFDLITKDQLSNMVNDLKNNLLDLLKIVEHQKILQVFTNKNDSNNCYLEIHAGTGGLDSQDFAMMLCRMYTKFANIKGFKFNIMDENNSDGIGIKSAIIKIEGLYAYGWLKNENGVHRLIRQSPYNADAKRQTSFVSIDVYPENDQDTNIEILDSDIKIDTYRSSGAGGQHVNTTDSAVRITHIPTAIVVTCQGERSQHKNKENALKMLKLKLLKLNQLKIQQEKQNSYMSKVDIDFGNQIRTYTLHPYQMVKDHRSNMEFSDIKNILDGEMDKIILSILSLD